MWHNVCMEKKKLSDTKLKYIFIAIMTCVISFAVPFVIKIAQNISINNNAESEKDESDKGDKTENIFPTLTVPASIKIDKFESDFVFEYSVKNLGEYSISIEIQNCEIATISDGKIIPIKVGETNIITKINCEPKIEKYTLLTVVDAVTQVDYKIKDSTDKIADKLFVNSTYFLEIDENATNKNIPNIIYSQENISQFNFIEKKNNISKFSFTIAKYGEFNFQYINKYCNKNINLWAYNFPTEINVNFNKNIYKNEKYYLYLFNNEYLYEANLDNIFNKVDFEISINNTVYDEIYYEINGDSISIKNNQIIAEKVGCSSITFISKISNISRTFIFDIRKIIPDFLTINSQKYYINSNNNLQLKIAQKYNFTIEVTPKYFYGELSFEHSQNIQFADSKITLLDTNPATITIKINGEIFCTFAISHIPEYTFQISLEQSSENISLTNNQLNITMSSNNFFVLKCLTYDTATSKKIPISITITIANQTIVSPTNAILELRNNTITLKAISSGITKIIFSNSDYGISYELIVNVS